MLKQVRVFTSCWGSKEKRLSRSDVRDMSKALLKGIKDRELQLVLSVCLAYLCAMQHHLRHAHADIRLSAELQITGHCLCCFGLYNAF